jgi:hypothetical protein
VLSNKTRALGFACAVACTGSHGPSATTPKASACGIRVGAPRALELPKYFRAYDPDNLNVPVEPPPEMADIRRTTKSFYFGLGPVPNNFAFIARRTDTTATKIRPYPVQGFDMVEDAQGHAWLLLGSIDTGEQRSDNVYLLDIDPSLVIRDHAVVFLPVHGYASDKRIGITKDGHVAVVWVEAVEDGLVLMASWLGPHQFRTDIVDRVQLTAAEAEVSLRTSTGLHVAADGADRIAIGWRPLAQVRILTTDMNGATNAPKVHRALAGDAMIATTLADHALFFWVDDDTQASRVVLATAADATPRPVASGSFQPITRAPKASSVDLLLVRSSGPQQIVSITCE